MEKSRTSEKYLSVAYNIGAQLCRTAYWHQDSCNWVGLEVNEKTADSWHCTLGYNFYEGTSGIAFFLSQLYSLTGENVFKRTASGALNHAFNYSQKKPGKFPIAFYTGKTGLLYALLISADKLNNSSCLQKGEILTREILRIKTSKLHFDIISGAAGAIPVLLLASEKLKTKGLKEFAAELGNYLLEHSAVFENTHSWKLPKQKHLPLTGFSHGASGIGYALVLLFKFTGNSKYLQAASEAFNYEDRYFNKVKKNWTDLRNTEHTDVKNTSVMSAWCYGAPGIGMARLAAWRIQEHASNLKWAEQACANVMGSFKSVANYSLCHGCFGNAELLLQYVNVLKNNFYNKTLNKIALNGITDFFDDNIPWSCGTPGGIYTPSFMTGIAGIGNFYLRMHSPEKIASGLILEELL